MRKIFYVVYPLEERLRKSLDIMRFIADPSGKHPAHITVRGPLQRPSNNLENFSYKTYGSQVYVNGVGYFFSAKQNTVFINCQSEVLREVWKKPDYGRFNPHITLYNGPSRDFAQMLLERLQHLRIQFSFEIGELSPLFSTMGQYTMGSMQFYNPEIFSKIVGEQKVACEIQSLTLDRKIFFIEQFARKLPEIASDGKLQFTFTLKRKGSPASLK